jgi:protein-arginine kinase activator protein McsA
LEKRNSSGKDKTKEILKMDLVGDARSFSEILKDKKQKMKKAAEMLEFELAALLRDEIKELEKQIKKTNAK